MAEKSIYRIPSLLRDLNPDAYKPRMISIGPYHNGEEKLKQMEDHKKRCLDSFLIEFRRDSSSAIDHRDILIAEFQSDGFLERVRSCYTEPLEPDKWSDDTFSELMLLDGCFLLELLLNDSSGNRAFLSYVKMDMLVLDNQIPLIVLTKLATMNERWVKKLTRNWRPRDSVTISQLIWKLYGIMNADIPANDDHLKISRDFRYSNTTNTTNTTNYSFKEDHNVLDAYRKGRIGTGAYNGWVSSLSIRELYYHGVKFRRSSDGSFRNVKFTVSYFIVSGDRFISWLRHNNHQINQNGEAQSSCNKLLTWITAAIRLLILLTLIITFWWLYILFGAAKGMFSLPRLTIDGTTSPTLLNLMDFERLHLRYEHTHPVTDYVLLMASLIRSKNDVEHLRKESILLCSPGWTNESVVQMFADLTRNVVFKGIRTTTSEIDALCERLPNKCWSVWRRLISPESSDVKSFVVALLTFYGLAITSLSTCFTIVKYFKK